MKRLKNILESSNLYISLIALFLIFYSFKNIFIIPVLVIYIIKLYRKINFKLIILLLLIFIILFTLKLPYENKIYGKVFIYNIEQKEYNNLITVKYKNKKYNFYTSKNYSIGEKFLVDADIIKYKGETIPNSFDSYSYYRSNNVYGKLKINSIEKIEGKHFNYYINKIYQKIINNYENNMKSYIDLIVFNKNDNKKDLHYNLSISHLIKLSGVHIFLLVFIINKFLFYFNMKVINQKRLILLVLLIIYIFQFNNLVILRILIYYLLQYIVYKYNLKVIRYNLIQINYLLLILLNTNLIYSNNIFIMYILSNTFHLLRPVINGKNFLYKSVISMFIANVLLIPFIEKLNILTLIIMPLYQFIIICIIYPLIFLSLFFYPLSKYISYIINIYDNFIIYMNNFSSDYIYNIGYMKDFYKVIYYYLIITAFYNKSLFNKILKIKLSIFIILIPNFKRMILSPRVYFLDVNQGDASVYVDKNYVIVVDSYQYVGSFLNSLGVNKIDYLILSHSDYDHVKEANSLIDNFNVGSVILSKYDTYDINFDNIIYADNNLNIYLDNLEINFLGPIKKYSKTNDNSLVFKLKYDDTSILYTGDIEIDAEIDIANKYNFLLKSDVLKVSHHGSKTSSNKYFLKYVSPFYSVISVGENNYNMPDNIVVDNLNKYSKSVYRTDCDQTLIYYNKRMYKYSSLTMKKISFIV